MDWIDSEKAGEAEHQTLLVPKQCGWCLSYFGVLPFCCPYGVSSSLFAPASDGLLGPQARTYDRDVCSPGPSKATETSATWERLDLRGSYKVPERLLEWTFKIV